MCLIYIKKESEENMRAFIKAKSAEKDPNVCKKQLNNTRVTEKNQKVTVRAGSADSRAGPKGGIRNMRDKLKGIKEQNTK